MIRTTSTQGCVLLYLFVLSCLVVAACGSAGSGVRHGVRTLDSIPRPHNFNDEPFKIAEQNIPKQNKSYKQIAEDLAKAAQQRTEQRARETLEELYGGDAGDKALAQALCSGMEQLSENADEDEDTLRKLGESIS